MSDGQFMVPWQPLFEGIQTYPDTSEKIHRDHCLRRADLNGWSAGSVAHGSIAENAWHTTFTLRPTSSPL